MCLFAQCSRLVPRFLEQTRRLKAGSLRYMLGDVLGSLIEAPCRGYGPRSLLGCFSAHTFGLLAHLARLCPRSLARFVVPW